MSINIKFDQLLKTGYLKPTNKYTIWRIISLLIIGSLFACVILVFYFVYQYSYLTLTNANAIVTLSSNLGADIVDNKNFTISQDIIRSKNNLPEINDKIRNIFYYVQSPSSTPATSTKTKQP